MAITQYGLNFTALENATLNISIPTDPIELLREIPLTANYVTEYYLGWGILIATFIILFWVLADKSPYTDFGYDNDKALGIVAGIVACLGITLMEINYITSLKSVAFFVMLSMATNIYILIMENKE